MKIGYEGEGPRLGMKTIFLTHEDALLKRNDLQDKMSEYMGEFDAVYVNVKSLNSIRLNQLVSNTLEFPITFEVPFSFCSCNFSAFTQSLFFLVVTAPPLVDYHRLQPTNVFIKVRSMSSVDFYHDVEVANAWADAGHQVLLMPEWDDSPANYGLVMVGAWKFLHTRVRLMPPVQNLLEIS